MAIEAGNGKLAHLIELRKNVHAVNNRAYSAWNQSRKAVYNCQSKPLFLSTVAFLV